MNKVDIIGHRNLFLTTGAILIILAIVLSLNLKPGIDLKGGTSWQIKFARSVNQLKLRNFIQEISGYPNLSVRMLEDGSYLIRIPSISESEHKQYLESIKQEFGDMKEISFNSISPVIGRELRGKFIRAAIIALLAIILYLAFSFRKYSYQINSFKYGMVSIICLIHDILLPAGVMGFLGWKFSVEIDTQFIVALLFIIGYSVNDTIVLLDRFREKLSNLKRKEDLKYLLNLSIKETFMRSVNTSLTTILVLVAIYFIGPISLKYFVLVLIIGTLVGSYSSLVIAPSLLYCWEKRK